MARSYLIDDVQERLEPYYNALRDASEAFARVENSGWGQTNYEALHREAGNTLEEAREAAHKAGMSGALISKAINAGGRKVRMESEGRFY